MSEPPATPTARLVPGAPPPAPASKSQKKKKTKTGKKSDLPDDSVEVPDAHSAALIDHAPSEGEVKEGVREKAERLEGEPKVRDVDDGRAGTQSRKPAARRRFAIIKARGTNLGPSQLRSLPRLSS